MARTMATLLFVASVASFCSQATARQTSRVNSTTAGEETAWAGRTKRAGWSSEEAPPFWANRGRRLRLPWGKLEERHNDGDAKASSEDLPPFWANRGRREGDEGQDDEEEVGRWDWLLQKREGRAAEDRDRRGLREALSKEEPFWAARGRRGLRDALSSEDNFWASRGRRSYAEGLPCTQAQQKWRKRQTARHSADIRTLGKGQSEDPFWPVRGKRAGLARQEDAADNADDDDFWAALERRSARP